MVAGREVSRRFNEQAGCYAAHPSDLGVAFAPTIDVETPAGTQRREGMMESTPAQQTTDPTRAPLAIATVAWALTLKASRRGAR